MELPLHGILSMGPRKGHTNRVTYKLNERGPPCQNHVSRRERLSMYRENDLVARVKQPCGSSDRSPYSRSLKRLNMRVRKLCLISTGTVAY